MKSLFGKIISILLSIFMPVMSAAPAAQPARTPAKATHDDAAYVAVVEEENVINEFFDDEDEITPMIIGEDVEAEAEFEAEFEAEDEVAIETVEEGATLNGVERAEAQADEEDAAYEAILEWDVSATDEDDVHMYYYEEDDDDFIDIITGAVRAIFAPMTVYAAEEITNDENTVTALKGGTIIVEGEGTTQSMLFAKWLNTEAFIPYYEAWCAENGIDENDYYIDINFIDENGDFTEPPTSADIHEDIDEEDYIHFFDYYLPVHINEIMREHGAYIWANLARVNPKNVVITGDVDAIGFGAFAFCTNLKNIIIENGLEEIAAGAFAGTAIETITVPETVYAIGNTAFNGCENLKSVILDGYFEEIGRFAFTDINRESKIYCNYTTLALLAGVKNPGILEANEDGEFEFEQEKNPQKVSAYTRVVVTDEDLSTFLQ